MSTKIDMSKLIIDTVKVMIENKCFEFGKNDFSPRKNTSICHKITQEYFGRYVFKDAMRLVKFYKNNNLDYQNKVKERITSYIETLQLPLNSFNVKLISYFFEEIYFHDFKGTQPK